MYTSPLSSVRSAAVMFGSERRASSGLTAQVIKDAFKSQRFTLNDSQASQIQGQVESAVKLIQENSSSTRIGMMAVDIAQDLHFNMMQDTSVQGRVEAALREASRLAGPLDKPEVVQAWSQYYDEVMSLEQDREFAGLLKDKGYSGVHMNWEDIDRDQGSSLGKRISDVGIWMREDESDLDSAKLALSVRRSTNFVDKILKVPAQNIKVHLNQNGRVTETTLIERLKELDLVAKDATLDRNVVVSNQFVVAPVPSKKMKGAWKGDKGPRAAFAFSIQPYGSKNMVITDVMKGSSNAVVSGSEHQLLYADLGDGQRAPFTISREEDRADLREMETQLKAQGMDVDVQRYYLIQVPLKKEAIVRNADMGKPPRQRGGGWAYPMGGGILEMATTKSFSFSTKGGGLDLLGGATSISKGLGGTRERGALRASKSDGPGFVKGAIDFGDPEGLYNEGSGYRGQRAEEPIRVTVCYFVVPKKKPTKADMENFTKTFEQWDKQAIWGGSLVVPSANK